MCKNFSYDLYGINICHDWTIYNQSNIIYLPEECANKTYTIEKPTNNFINPIQKNFNITITNNYIIPKKYASNTNKYNNVNNCMKICTKIVEELSFEENYKVSKKSYFAHLKVVVISESIINGHLNKITESWYSNHTNSLIFTFYYPNQNGIYFDCLCPLPVILSAVLLH
jgi:hypothetical protein